MRTVDYVAILEDGIRERHSHSVDKKRIASFVVQLEILIEGKWQPVIRYDSAHGFAHIDLYKPNRPVEKIPLNLDFKSALNLADWDIGNNWEKYVLDYKRET